MRTRYSGFALFWSVGMMVCAGGIGGWWAAGLVFCALEYWGTIRIPE